MNYSHLLQIQIFTETERERIEFYLPAKIDFNQIHKFYMYTYQQRSHKYTQRRCAKKLIKHKCHYTCETSKLKMPTKELMKKKNETIQNHFYGEMIRYKILSGLWLAINKQLLNGVNLFFLLSICLMLSIMFFALGLSKKKLIVYNCIVILLSVQCA